MSDKTRVVQAIAAVGAVLDAAIEEEDLVDRSPGLCESCGARLKWQSECEQCWGGDEYGCPVFCPNCDYCCGC